MLAMDKAIGLEHQPLLTASVVDYPPPNKNLTWLDDMKKWPTVLEADILCYLVEQRACDLRQMRALKSTLAYNYFLSECVGRVLVADFDEKVYDKSQVRPSQSVHESYDCWLLAEKNGVVLSAGCECKAGRSKVCSHVSSVLFKINYGQSQGLCGEQCTDVQQRWNSGTSKNVVPSTIRATNFKRPKPGSNLEEYVQIREVPPIKQAQKFTTTAYFISIVNQSPSKLILETPGSLFNSILTEPICPDTSTTDSFLPPPGDRHGAHELSDSGTTYKCDLCNSIYVTLIQGNEESYKKLSELTVDQASSPNLDYVALWKVSRKLRLTASSSNTVPKRSTTGPFTFLRNHVFGKFKGNTDTARGNYGETEARKWYQLESGVQIIAAGTVISPVDPWLSGSPDGLIGEDVIVEIKCPDPDKFNSYLSRKTYDVNKREDGTHELRKTKSYYTQVQLCLYCTQRKKCLFIIYLGPDNPAISFTVIYDEQFVNEKVQDLKTLYFTKMLPFLVDRIRSKILVLPEIYTKLFVT